MGVTFMSGYCWNITADHVDEDAFKRTVGPWNGDESLLKLEPANKWGEAGTRQFKMYDDDGNLYYEGIIGYTSEYADRAESLGFEPLDDYGMPNAGAVRIDYKEGDEWKQL